MFLEHKTSTTDFDFMCVCGSFCCCFFFWRKGGGGMRALTMSTELYFWTASNKTHLVIVTVGSVLAISVRAVIWFVLEQYILLLYS